MQFLHAYNNTKLHLTCSENRSGNTLWLMSSFPL